MLTEAYAERYYVTFATSDDAARELMRESFAATDARLAPREQTRLGASSAAFASHQGHGLYVLLFAEAWPVTVNPARSRSDEARMQGETDRGHPGRPGGGDPPRTRRRPDPAEDRAPWQHGIAPCANVSVRAAELLAYRLRHGRPQNRSQRRSARRSGRRASCISTSTASPSKTWPRFSPASTARTASAPC